MAEFAAIAEEYDALLSDEVYDHSDYEVGQFSLRAESDHVVATNSFSKTIA